MEKNGHVWYIQYRQRALHFLSGNNIALFFKIRQMICTAHWSFSLLFVKPTFLLLQILILKYSKVCKTNSLYKKIGIWQRRLKLIAWQGCLSTIHLRCRTHDWKDAKINTLCHPAALRLTYPILSMPTLWEYIDFWFSVARGRRRKSMDLFLKTTCCRNWVLICQGWAYHDLKGGFENWVFLLWYQRTLNWTDWGKGRQWEMYLKSF